MRTIGDAKLPYRHNPSGQEIEGRQRGVEMLFAVAEKRTRYGTRNIKAQVWPSTSALSLWWDWPSCQWLFAPHRGCLYRPLGKVAGIGGLHQWAQIAQAVEAFAQGVKRMPLAPGLSRSFPRPSVRIPRERDH